MNSGRPTRLQQPQEQRYPFLPALCVVFLYVQTILWLPKLGLFNVRQAWLVDACDRTRVGGGGGMGGGGGGGGAAPVFTKN